jgi:NAD dependent epimerase/dehydratase family enzyme
MKNILISGGTGFVGKHISDLLLQSSYNLYILTRSTSHKPERSNVTYVEWLTPQSKPENNLPKIDAIINLAGESINGRWTDDKKQAILNSRLKVTEELLNLSKKMKEPPSVWINASAIGYYGTSET